MKKLLNKELKLTAHPTNFLFLALSAMMLIPSYPYYLVFFYTTLGIFFLCQNGRENNDIAFTLALPIKKRDVVRSRMLTAVILEGVQLALAIPFAIIRREILEVGNESGMDGNIAFFGLALLFLGLGNYVFFTGYYKAPHKVGRAFVLTSVVEFLYAVLAEASCFAVPFFRDVLDTRDPAHLTEKLLILLAGLVLFVLLTLAAERKAEKSFEALDF